MGNDTQQDVSPTRLRTFDFLRGLAILGVIVVHTSQSFPSQISTIDFVAGLGRFGVQLFYFISALTMCYMWEQRKGEISPIRNFYIRRFFRIAPLFWIAIIGYFFLSGRIITDSINEIILSATFLHGFSPNSINSIVPGGWSIAVEMTFYLFFPFIILTMGNNRTRYLIFAILIWLLYLMVIRGYLSDILLENGNTPYKNREFLYMIFPNQAPIFFLGCYLYFLITDKKKLEIYELFGIIIWCISCAVLSYIKNEGHFSFPSVYIAIGIFVFACIKYNVKLKHVEALGKNSYSIYLIHFLIIDFFAYALPISKGISSLLTAILLVTITSYIISLFIEKFIERRIQRVVKHITKLKPTQQPL
ncbi:acyltransferase [Polynucleobacter paneuropaeus]|nr:acyltransferase [Polynucleobacter paneuropaeus]